MLKDATAIVGIGETPFAKRLEGSEKKLAQVPRRRSGGRS